MTDREQPVGWRCPHNGKVSDNQRCGYGLEHEPLFLNPEYGENEGTMKALRRQRDAAELRADAFEKALRKIATQDYRGNGCMCRGWARNALGER